MDKILPLDVERRHDAVRDDRRTPGARPRGPLRVASTRRIALGLDERPPRCARIGRARARSSRRRAAPAIRASSAFRPRSSPLHPCRRTHRTNRSCGTTLRAIGAVKGDVRTGRSAIVTAASPRPWTSASSVASASSPARPAPLTAWYVATRTLRRPARRAIGARADAEHDRRTVGDRKDRGARRVTTCAIHLGHDQAARRPPSGRPRYCRSRPRRRRSRVARAPRWHRRSMRRGRRRTGRRSSASRRRRADRRSRARGTRASPRDRARRRRRAPSTGTARSSRERQDRLPDDARHAYDCELHDASSMSDSRPTTSPARDRESARTASSMPGRERRLASRASRDGSSAARLRRRRTLPDGRRGRAAGRCGSEQPVGPVAGCDAGVRRAARARDPRLRSRRRCAAR